MKKIYFTIFFFTSIFTFGQDLVITGVIDGPLPGGFPKGIELYVVNNIADLSIYGLERAGNGAASTGSPTYTFPADSYNAGDFIYVGKTSTATNDSPAAFQQYLGVTLTYQTDAVNHNGDDAMILYKSGVAVDYFGKVGEDGTGKTWECKDGWAYRNNGSGPNTTFTVSEWSFSGVDALDGCDLADDSGTNAACSSVFPVGTYSLATASATDNNIDGFAMYPNPVTKGFLTINTSANAQKEIRIFDVLGKKVLSKNMKNKVLDVSKLSAGVYILKVIESGKIAARKLVIK